MDKKKILITGANGLLGQKLANILKDDPNVVFLATSKGANRNPRLPEEQFSSLDITNPSHVEEVFKRFSPDVVVHCAAMTQVDPCELDRETCLKVNVQGTRYLLSAALAEESHFVYVSTDFVFDGQSGPYAEEDAPGPVNFYGHSKLMAESEVKKYSGPWSIIRTVLVYGIIPNSSRSNIVLWVRKSLSEGKEIQVVNDQERTPTLVEDLAEGTKTIAVDGHRGVFHLSGPETLSVLEMAHETARHFNLDSELINPVTSSSLTAPGQRPAKTGFIIEKARRELNFNPRTFIEGLSLVESQLEGLA